MTEKIIGIAILAGGISYVFFMPDWITKKLDLVFYIIVELIFEAVIFFEKLLTVATVLVHFLGKLATLSLLASALAIFSNEAIAILGYRKFFFGEQYVSWLDLFTKPYTWAAATTIVATTVAIANLRKLDLDFQEFIEKQRERLEVRRKERKH